MGFIKTIRKYPANFWTSNTIELFERWAWYGFYIAFPLFLVNSQDIGALGFSQAQKGIIMGTGSMLLYFLPVLTGAIADKVGYKKILLLAFATYISGFAMLNTFHSFELTFIAFLREAAQRLDMSQVELTNFLWENHHPYNIWMLYAGVAVSATIFLWIYDRFIIRK